MTEVTPPHEAIASDTYWEPIRSLPAVPVRAYHQDGFSSTHMFAQFGASKVHALYDSAAHSGHVSRTIPTGDKLPLVERGGGLIRLVEDVRKYPARKTNRPRMLARRDDDHETFDELALNMIGDHLYMGKLTRTSVVNPDKGYCARVWRIVNYMTGSSSGFQLEGLSSDELVLNTSDALMNYVIPPIIVGEAYKRNRAGTLASKVVAAEVLIESGLRSKASKKVWFNVKPKAAFYPI